jgi:hypothetical protein
MYLTAMREGIKEISHSALTIRQQFSRKLPQNYKEEPAFPLHSSISAKPTVAAEIVGVELFYRPERLTLRKL